MKKFQTIFLKYKLFIPVFFILLLGSVSVFTGWSMVDDGKSAQVSYDFIKQTNFNLLLEPESGRFRPFYWLFQCFTFLLAGTNSHFHHTIQILLFISATYLFYYIINRNDKSLSALLFSVLFIIDFRLIENWYRLGTQEPLQLILLLLAYISFLTYRKTEHVKYFIYSIVLFTLSCLHKETSLAFIFIPVFYLFIDLFNKRIFMKNLVYILCISIIGILIRMIAINLYPTLGYASLYKIDSSIYANFSSYLVMIRSGYSPILEIVIVTFVIRSFFYIYKNNLVRYISKFENQLFWVYWFIIFLAIQLPWGFTIGRYLLISLPGLLTFMSIEILEICKNIISFLRYNRDNWKRRDVNLSGFILLVFLAYIMVVIFFYNILMSISYIIWVKYISIFDTKFINTITLNVNDDSTVFFNADESNNPPLELFMETGWHLKYLKKLNNTQVKYLSSGIPKKGDLIVEHTNTPVYNNEELGSRFNATLIENYDIRFKNYILAGVFKIIKSLPDLLINTSREQKNDLNLITFSSYLYNWKIYKIN